MNQSRRRGLVQIAATCALQFLPVVRAAGQTSPDRVVEVRIRQRKVIAPGNVIRVTEGETVELRWTTDEAVELHLHGYAIAINIGPDRPVVMVVEARASGRFPITSHGWAGGGHGHDTIAYLEVYPR